MLERLVQSCGSLLEILPTICPLRKRKNTKIFNKFQQMHSDKWLNKALFRYDAKSLIIHQHALQNRMSRVQVLLPVPLAMRKRPCICKGIFHRLTASVCALRAWLQLFSGRVSFCGLRPQRKTLWASFSACITSLSGFGKSFCNNITNLYPCTNGFAKPDVRGFLCDEL